MKPFFYFMLLVFPMTFICGQSNGDVVGPIISFDTEFIELGQIQRGDKREMTFEFTNTGEEDIIIELVSSCDCTTIDYPRSPIKKGETGVLEVVFDSTEKETSETVDIDVILKNIDPITGGPIMVFLSYSFELLQ